MGIENEEKKEPAQNVGRKVMVESAFPFDTRIPRRCVCPSSQHRMCLGKSENQFPAVSEDRSLLQTCHLCINLDHSLKNIIIDMIHLQRLLACLL